MSYSSNKFEIDFKYKHLCIHINCSLIKAMEIIERGKERICFLVSKDEKLLKVITDGDIRRALIRGFKTTDKAIKIHDRKPIVAIEDYPERSIKKLTKWVGLLPVINHESKIVGLIRIKDLESNYNIRQKSIAIIGLGYVGLTLALILSESGFRVFGLDKNKILIKQLLNRKAPFYENGISNLLNTHINNFFHPTNNSDEILSDIYIITVGTPINPDTKKPNISHITSVIEEISKKIKKNDLIILRSTVPVGCTRDIVIPILEMHSRLKAGIDFFVSFCPERTAEGKALVELRYLPQIVGGFDETSRQMAMRFFNEYTHTVIDVGSLEAAEMCKLLDNTYRDTCFAYSNQMALITEKLGLNLVDLIKKVNLGYERSKIPLPSPGVGGPCLSKDPYILEHSFSNFGIKCSLTSAARKVNEDAPNLIFNRCKKLLSNLGKNILKEKIFIIGFAFKGDPATSDLRESTTIWFLNHIKSKGVKKIWGYDPIVDKKDLIKLNVKPCTIEQGFDSASLVLVMNNHKSYNNLNLNNLLKSMNKPGVFYDGWNLFHDNEKSNIPGIVYASTGSG